MKNIKNFNDFDKINEEFFNKNNNLIELDDYKILNLYKNSRNELKRIFKIISHRLSEEYITISFDIIDQNDIDRLKNLGFGVKIYNDSNEYSEDFRDKIKISWKCVNCLDSYADDYEDG